MHFLINICIGILSSWAFRKRVATDGLGLWRPLAGALGAVFPHVDNAFYSLSNSYALLHQYAETWSLVLCPLYAWVLSQALALLAGGYLPESPRTWQKFFIPVFVGMLLAIGLGVFTEQGVALFAPFWHGRASLGVIHSFDIGLLFGLSGFILLGIAIARWKTDLARIVFVLLIAYLGILGTFKAKADNIAERYAQAMKIDVVSIYTEPQPLSPFYWRIVVHTADERLHETTVSLKRKNVIKVTASTSPLRRAKAAYNPVHAALWRIYNRFGYNAPSFARSAWESEISQKLSWMNRFAVIKDFVEYENQHCARFKDIRFKGTQSGMLGVYLICQNTTDRNEDNWRAYQAATDGTFFRLNSFLY